MSPDPNFKAWPVFKNEHPGHANLMERLDITDVQREELAHLALIQKSHWVAVVGGKDKALAQAQAREEKLREALIQIANDSAPDKMEGYSDIRDLAVEVSHTVDEALAPASPSEALREREAKRWDEGYKSCTDNLPKFADGTIEALKTNPYKPQESNQNRKDQDAKLQ